MSRLHIRICHERRICHHGKLRQDMTDCNVNQCPADLLYPFLYFSVTPADILPVWAG
jgi:hypothetical protein